MTLLSKEQINHMLFDTWLLHLTVYFTVAR
jgi:hypothetical protein